MTIPPTTLPKDGPPALRATMAGSCVIYINTIKQRLDQIRPEHTPLLSRNYLQQLIRSGQVMVAGQMVTDTAYKLQPGQKIAIIIPPAAPSEVLAQTIPLDIVYEDADLLVINKPAGLVVHPAVGNRDMTMVNALLAHCGDQLSGIGGVQRPGIVHRLDKETSGLMVVAKNDAAHQGLSAQLADRSLSRVYHALVWGVPHPLHGTIDAPIGRSPRNRQKMAVVANGRAARTNYKVLKLLAGGAASLVECKLQTGRTHQIRVHLQHLGYPLIGDPTYGRRKPVIYPDHLTEFWQFPRQALHAKEIAFIHPHTNETRHFNSELPADLLLLLI